MSAIIKKSIVATKLARALERLNFKITVDSTYSELVLLTGPPRSGTTWLNRELCNNAHTFNFFPECSLLTKQVALFSQILHYTDERRFSAYFRHQQHLISYYRENIARMLTLMMEIHQDPDNKNRILILKDPDLCLYLNETFDLFPAHKLIVLVRDPRDVIASMKNVAARRKEIWDLPDISTKIFSYYHKIQEYQRLMNNKNMLFVRYEDLIKEGLLRIQLFLGCPAFINTTNQNESNSKTIVFNPSDPFFSEHWLHTTTSQRIGSYEDILSDDEILQIETSYSGVMQHWGYKIKS